MRVLISGGGTGGHLFPAIAVALALSRSDPEGAVLYVGRTGGLEEHVVPGYRIPFATIAAVKVDMEEIWRNWRVPLLLPWAVWQAGRVLRRFHPDVVLGTGGYVSAPLILAAAAMRVPVVLQEQNYLPGRTTRLLARVAAAITTAYVDSARYLDGRPTFLTGTPVRPEFQQPRTDFPERPHTVLIVGGSQGAHRINQAVAQAIPLLLTRDGIAVSHQTGVQDLPALQAVRDALPDSQRDRYGPFAFSDELPSLLRASDLVVSRAGASTLSETSALGVPMILIPGPFAGGHQNLNARPFSDAGAAVIIPDEELNGSRLTKEILAIMAEPMRYRSMVEAMRAMGRPNAADAVVDILRRVVHRP